MSVVLTGAILNSFEQKYRHQHRSSHVLVPLLERIMQEELTALLRELLYEQQGAESRGSVPLGTIANIASWAMFGADLQWSQEETAMPKVEMMNVILQAVMEGTRNLVDEVS